MFCRPSLLQLSLLTAASLASIPLWSASAQQPVSAPVRAPVDFTTLELPDADCVFTVDAKTGEVVIDTESTHAPHLDIKPGKCPNTIRVDHAGDCDDCDDDDQGHMAEGEIVLDDSGMMVATLRMSVLGNAFDVTQVDLGTIGLTRFNANAPEGETVTSYPVLKPIRIEFADRGTPFLGDEFCGCHDLQGDCELDLNLKFNRNDVISCFGLDDEPHGTKIRLRLTARTSGDRGFRITDCVKIRRN
ncbi:MAG: hypothetical protein ACKVWV_16480 [Planctomycetota bacterium]